MTIDESMFLSVVSIPMLMLYIVYHSYLMMLLYSTDSVEGQLFTVTCINYMNKDEACFLNYQQVYRRQNETPPPRTSTWITAAKGCEL